VSVLTFDIKGFEDIMGRLERAPARLVEEVNRELKDSADRIARNAKRDAPRDEGRLANAISVEKVSDTEYNVISPVSYSPFIEWGTRRKVRVPAELASYAAKFKGKTDGSVGDFLKAIIGWVKRKGIRFDSAGLFKSGKRKGKNKQLTVEQTAYIVFHFIMLNGIAPQPFFFKNLDAEKPVLLGNVTKVLKDIV
jgi:bacteriophage HK97-gp10 putative tail-component